MNARTQIHNSLRDLVVLSIFGALMVISDQLMNFLPNVHLIAMFVILLTRFYRVKALIPIYIFVLLDGVLEGFFLSTWVMYSYIWLILWFAVMLLPKKLPKTAEAVIYPLLGAAHGLLFGILCSPASYFLFFPKTVWSFANYKKYILSGLPFDIVHMTGNFFACMLVFPLLSLMRKMYGKKRT